MRVPAESAQKSGTLDGDVISADIKNMKRSKIEADLKCFSFSAHMSCIADVPATAGKKVKMAARKDDSPLSVVFSPL